MGDFLLDFRIGELRGRSAIKAASLLKFCEETKVKILERETFALVLTRVDDFGLWGPCVGSSERGPVWVAAYSACKVTVPGHSQVGLLELITAIVVDFGQSLADEAGKGRVNPMRVLFK
jgi:hypothetical protein